MKHRSLQWRATLWVSALIAAICILMNLLICYTNTFYIDNIDSYVVSVGSELAAAAGFSAEDTSFYLDLSNLLNVYQRGFNIKSWAITLTLTLCGGFLTYFISGTLLRPLHQFIDEMEQVQIQNIARPIPVKDAAPDIERLANSFNAMLCRLSMAFQSQKRFIANAAHEFRTPLAIMQTKLELFERLEAPTAKDQKELTSALSSQTKHLSELIKTLLELSEMQTAEMQDEVAVEDIVEEVLCDLDSLAAHHQVTLSKETAPFTMTGNDTLLYRLVFNLVENAIKYNLPGGSVCVSLTQEDSHFVLRVRDTGMGIPRDMWQEIMKPFSRVDKSRSRSMGGVGLGLALVQEIVSLHQGEILVEESSAQGTVMKVIF